MTSIPKNKQRQIINDIINDDLNPILLAQRYKIHYKQLANWLALPETRRTLANFQYLTEVQHHFTIAQYRLQAFYTLLKFAVNQAPENATEQTRRAATDIMKLCNVKITDIGKLLPHPPDTHSTADQHDEEDQQQFFAVGTEEYLADMRDLLYQTVVGFQKQVKRSNDTDYRIHLIDLVNYMENNCQLSEPIIRKLDDTEHVPAA